MAVDAYMMFMDYTGTYLDSESQVEMDLPSTDTLGADFKAQASGKTSKVFEVQSFNFGIEQTLNIGSQSTGAGAGKVVFNPFHIDRKIDKSSPTIFGKACSGTPFKMVSLGFRKSGGGDVSGLMFLRFDFKLVAVKTISWEHDDEAPKETMDFEYGGLVMRYCQQNADGTLAPAIAGGWNRVKNIADVTSTPIT